MRTDRRVSNNGKPTLPPPGCGQLDLVQLAEARRDDGIARASSHAESVNAQWNRTADATLDYFLRSRKGEPFLSEEFVLFARAHMLEPPDGRAWGAPIRRAAHAERIVKTGEYRPANTSNLSPKPLWRERPV